MASSLKWMSKMLRSSMASSLHQLSKLLQVVEVVEPCGVSSQTAVGDVRCCGILTVGA